MLRGRTELKLFLLLDCYCLNGVQLGGASAPGTCTDLWQLMLWRGRHVAISELRTSVSNPCRLSPWLCGLMTSLYRAR